MKKYYWVGDNFKLFLNELEDTIDINIEGGSKATLTRKEGSLEDNIGIIKATFTQKEFSSFICDIVKYILEQPELAREIPFYTSSNSREHGLLGKAICQASGGIKIDELWLRYHGIEEGDEVNYEKNDKELIFMPLKTKAKIIDDKKAPLAAKTRELEIRGM